MNQLPAMEDTVSGQLVLLTSADGYRLQLGQVSLLFGPPRRLEMVREF